MTARPLQEFLHSLNIPKDDQYMFNTMKKLKEQPYSLITKWNNTKYYMIGYNENASDLTNEIVNLANGVIVSQENNDILHYCYPRIRNLDEMSSTDPYKVYHLYDGTIIKLYYYNGELQVGTNFCEDASRSKFNNDKTFYELFMETVRATGLNLDELNKDISYTFIMQNPNNSTIVEHKEHRLILLSAVDMNTLDELDTNDLRLVNVTNLFAQECDFTIEKVLNELNQPDDKLALESDDILGYLFVQNGYRYKCEIDLYIKLKELRGSCENDEYRYLQLLKENKVDEYLKYYPSRKETFESVDKKLDSFALTVMNTYRKKFIYHHQFYIEKYINFIVNEIHQDFLKTKINRNTQIVKDFIIKRYTVESLAHYIDISPYK